MSENFEDILKGLSEAKNKKVRTMRNFMEMGIQQKKYRILAKIDLDKSIIQKQITY